MGLCNSLEGMSELLYSPGREVGLFNSLWREVELFDSPGDGWDGGG